MKTIAQFNERLLEGQIKAQELKLKEHNLKMKVIEGLKPFSMDYLDKLREEAKKRK